MSNLEYYETWKGQKELEHIVTNRILYRPKTTGLSLFVLYFLFVTISVVCFISFFAFIQNIFILIFTICFAELFLIETLLRLCFVKTIRCYQHYAKEKTRRRCMCIPSCSDYAIGTLKHFPLIIAFIKIYKRLFKTCKGEMYLIDKPYKKYSQ